MRKSTARLVYSVMILVSLTATSKGDSAAERKFEMARKKEVDAVEKALATKGGGADKETWYVLLFSERADRVAASGSTGRKGGTRGSLSFNSSSDSNCVKIQGRENAAEAVVSFMMSAPTAQEKLGKGPVRGPGTVNVTRDWDFRAFRSDTEAQALYSSIVANSESAKKRRKSSERGK